MSTDTIDVFTCDRCEKREELKRRDNLAHPKGWLRIVDEQSTSFHVCGRSCAVELVQSNRKLNP